MYQNSEIEEFIRDFTRHPYQRKEIIDLLVGEEGRVLLNVPGYGTARRISSRLRDGSFSDFYEYEKSLARTLHPVLAGLNLNLISDILINNLFFDKYSLYERDVTYILAAAKKPDFNALKNVILKMVGTDGHYMVVKFYDLVLRTIDPALFKTAKSAELAIIGMKKTIGDDEADNRKKINKLLQGFSSHHGNSASGLLLRRMEWDDALRRYMPGGEEERGDEIFSRSDQQKPVYTKNTEQPEDRDADTSGNAIAAGDHAVAETTRESRTMKYARLIKDGYLDALEDDEAGIRGIVEGIFRKNDALHGSSRAEEIVHDVLSIWIDDDSIEEVKRDILAKVLAERQGAIAGEASAEDDLVDSSDNLFDETDADAGAEDIPMPVEEQRGAAAAAVPEIFDNKLDELVENIPDEHSDMIAETNEIPAEEISDNQDAPGEGVIAHEQNLDDAGIIEAGGDIQEAAGDDEALQSPALDEVDTIDAENEVLESVTQASDNADAPLHAGDSVSEDDKFLMSEEEMRALTGAGPAGNESASDEGFLIAEQEEADLNTFEIHEHEKAESGSFLIKEKPEEKTEEKSARTPLTDQDRDQEVPEKQKSVQVEEKAADESFVIQDELLFEDKSLTKKRSVIDRKPGNKVQIRLKEFTGSERGRRLYSALGALRRQKPTEDPRAALRKEACSDETISGFSKLVESDGFEEALDYITKSVEFEYAEKALLLEKWLKVVGEKRGWFASDREGRLARINRLIVYYANIVRGVRGDKTIKDEQKRDKDVTPRENVQNVRAGADDALDGSSPDEKIYQKLTAIIHVFSDSIDALSPFLEKLYPRLPEQYRNLLRGEAENIRKKMQEISEATVAMVRLKLPDQVLIGQLNGLTPMRQYLWSESIKKALDLSNIEDAFKVFKKEKGVYKELIRISKIVKLNNKNDLLKNMHEAETSLVDELSGAFDRGEIKELWNKTAARQMKDKVKPVKDLVELIEEMDTDESGKIADEIAQKPIAKTGERSLKTAHEINEFQEKYRPGDDSSESLKRIHGMRDFFASLARGEEHAVHFAVYYKPQFTSFLHFVNTQVGLPALLNIKPALQYCNDNKIL